MILMTAELRKMLGVLELKGAYEVDIRIASGDRLTVEGLAGAKGFTGVIPAFGGRAAITQSVAVDIDAELNPPSQETPDNASSNN